MDLIQHPPPASEGTMKELRCREVGFDCEAVIRAESEDEVMRQAGEHARKVHGLQDISDDQVKAIRSKIRNE
jgi:predicted small metal-binding protein